MDALIVALVIMYVIIFVLGIRAAIEPHLLRHFGHKKSQASYRVVTDKGVTSDSYKAKPPRRAA